MVGYLNQYTQGLSAIWKRSLDTLRAKPTKWSNTLEQFVGFCRRIIYVCLTILYGWHLKGLFPRVVVLKNLKQFHQKAWFLQNKDLTYTIMKVI